MVEFCKVHLSIILFVVEFEAFHVVVNISDILVLLYLGEDGQELIHLQLLLV